jgi:dTDP-4-dehydrorhamnose 3,5-epimerase
MNQFKITPDLQIGEFIYKTDFEGLFYIHHKKFNDERGFYAEISRLPEIENAINGSFVVKQVNLALSNVNVSRGLHAEGWNKLVTVITGESHCVLADIRPDSATFGQTELFVLGSSEKSLPGSLFIPAGMANSLCVTAGPVNYLYCVDQLYSERDKVNDIAVSLFDPDLNISWPIPRSQMIISERDRQAITLREKYPDKFK